MGRCLVIGCGYLGLRVARAWMAEGHSVMALTRSVQRAKQFQAEGIEPVIGDVLSPANLPDFPVVDNVLIALAPDRTAGATAAQIYVAGLGHLLDHLAGDTRRVISISSTGVLGQNDGSWVDESSPCHPQREGGRAVWEGELRLLEHPLGGRSIRLRLAGLYGPGRIPRHDDLVAGRPIAISDGFLNLIHVDDATHAVLAAASRPLRLPALYLVADGVPVRRKDYLRELATLVDAPEPVFVAPDNDDSAMRSRSDKRVRNDKMRRELMDTFRYPSYREGLAAIVSVDQDAESESQ